MGLSIHMLGAFRVLKDDEPIALPRSRKARAVLAYVAMARRPIARDALVDMFFAETKDPKGGLRWVISRLRAVLGKTLVTTTPAKIALDAESVRLDIERLEKPIAPDASIADLRAVEAIVGGEFLADVSVAKCPEYEAWRLANQVTCHEQHAAILQALVRKTLGKADASRYARKLVNLDVTQEASWALLVESMLAVNQLADARHVQRLAVEQLERDGIRTSGALEAAWTRYGSRSGVTERPANGANANGLGLKPRVGVLRGKANGAAAAAPDRLADIVYRACAVNKTVTVLAPSMSSRLDDEPARAMAAARDLGVDLLLAGTLIARESGMQIEVQLIDATSGDGVFLWNKSFDSQCLDEVAERFEAYLAARMEIDLPIALVARVREKSPEELTARDKYLLALPRLFSADGFDPYGAYELLESALSQKPYFGQACCALSLIRLFMPQYNDDEDQLQITLSLARRAVEICQDDAFVLGIAAVNISHITRDPDTGIDLARHALSINPYSVMAGLSMAILCHYAGDDETCFNYVDAVESRSETEPITFYCHTIRAMAHYQQHNYDEALKWSRKAVGHNPKHVMSLRYLLASLAMTGNTEEAKALARQVVAIDPSENVAFFGRRSAYRSRRKAEHLCEGLRRAGLPETA